MAWEEAELPKEQLLDRLATARRRVRSTPQLIHGDLLGSVLFGDDGPPTIIDWAPYWRPAALGAAIAAVDAACWHGAPVEAMRSTVDDPQLLVRALLFRMATLHGLGRWSDAMHARHEPVVDALLS